jgi:hypothetical protein
MNRTSQYYLAALSALALMAAPAPALAADRSVSAAEANGTYRDGKSEIKILSVGPGKLMDIVKPRDEGSASGEATIKNDVAIFVPPDTDGCKLTMTFLPDGSLKVEQEGRPVDCGFGRMAPAEGTYKKVSSAKPKFDAA